MTLGQRLHAARFAKGYKLREVEALTGVSIATISRVERDITNIESAALFKLAGCYGVTVGSLLGEDDTRQMTSDARPNEALQTDALQKAKDLIEHMPVQDYQDLQLGVANVYAAIAQAEQLKRIADALEAKSESGESWQSYQEFKRHRNKAMGYE